MIGKYSAFNMLDAYNKNKSIIDEYVKGNTVESYDEETILNLSIGMFVFIFLIVFIFWFFALFFLMSNWNKMSDIGKVLGVLSLMGLGGPFATIIIVLATRRSA